MRAQTLSQLLKMRMALYKLREEREIKPETFTALLTSILYEKRFGPYFTEPVVAGLNEKVGHHHPPPRSEPLCAAQSAPSGC